MPDRSMLVIGCGSIGERHVRCFQKTGRTRVTACDANSALLETVGRTYGVDTVGDWNAALESRKFDSVVIATPAHLHVRMAMRALELGCHVLLEKPLSQSLEGTRDLLTAHEKSGRQVAVAYVHHVFPFLSQAKEFVLRKDFGPVRLVTHIGGQPFHRMRPAHAVHYSKTYYRDHKTGGGAIQDALTHIANWVESVVGPTDSVLCDAAHLALPDVTVEDTVNVAARNGEVLVNYSLNQFQAPNEATIQLNSATASVRIEYHRQRWGVFREGDADWTWHDAPVSERDAHYIAQATAFLDQLDGQPSRLCTLSAALQTLRFNLAALEAAASGKRVACNSLHG